jgi:acyl phosphate:glycerol-3-phosphate acyltransferase
LNAYLITAALSYTLGSIPFGLILVRLFRGEDVRQTGSGNIGATNVARTSPALGAVTLILDAAKGTAAVLLCRWLFVGSHAAGIAPFPLLAALCAILGHMFPVWLKFRGGKGVATCLGSFALLAPKSTVAVAFVFLVVVGVSRYVSLGSVAAAAIFPVAMWRLHECGTSRSIAIPVAAALLVIWKHRENLRRIASGTESKFGGKHA